MGERVDPAELKFVNAWLRSQHLPNFDADFEDGMVGLSVMFRKLGQPGDTVHKNNHIAVWLTSWPWEKAPFGNNCHCEVIMDLCRGCVLRLGTMYMRETEDQQTKKKVLIPGSSFIIPINDYRNYDAQRFDADRSAQLHALRVAIQNLGMPFNVTGYRMRAFMPYAIGTPAYCPETHSQALSVQGGCPPPIGTAHCTQLSVILLQAAGHSMAARGCVPYTSNHWVHTIRSMHAPSAVPNSVFRQVHGLSGVRYFRGILTKGSLRLSVDDEV